RGRIGLLPGNGAADRFIGCYRFLKSQLEADAGRAADHMLGGVARQQQMHRSALSRKHDKLAFPFQLGCDCLLPLQFGYRGFLVDVIDSSGRLTRGCGNRNSVGYVLDITSRAAPCSQIVGEQYRGSTIGDAVERREESVERISGTGDHWQTQDGSGNPGVVHDGFFDCDLVVAIIQPAEDALHHAHGFWWIELPNGAQGRVFRQRQGFESAGLYPMEYAPRTIDVHAADDDNAQWEVMERVDQLTCLLSGTQNEVYDHVWGELLDFFSVVGKRIPIGANTQNTIGNSRGGGTAMQNRHLLTGIGQFADQERADETVAANEENSHMSLGRLPRIRR